MNGLRAEVRVHALGQPSSSLCCPCTVRNYYARCNIGRIRLHTTKVNFHHLGICFKTPGYRRSVFIWKSAFYRARDRSKYATIIIGKVCTLKGGALNRLRNFYYDIQQLCFSLPACHSIYSFLYHLTNNWRCYKSIVLYLSIIVDSKFLVIDIFNPSTAQGDLYFPRRCCKKWLYKQKAI